MRRYKESRPRVQPPFVWIIGVTAAPSSRPERSGVEGPPFRSGGRDEEVPPRRLAEPAPSEVGGLGSGRDDEGEVAPSTVAGCVSHPPEADALQIQGSGPGLRGVRQGNSLVGAKSILADGDDREG